MSKQHIRGNLMKAALILLMGSGGTAAFGAKGNAAPPPLAKEPTPIQIFGVWHCGNHYCDWNEDFNYLEFDKANRWLIERGGPGTEPSVNLVVLSFVNPLKLLQLTDAGLFGMIPKGMTQGVVDYFKNDKKIRVMLSIGGITYTDDWDAALALNPELLATHAATIAQTMGVGIEIDYENSSSPNIQGLARFIAEYRRQVPFDVTGANHAARLTIDVGAGDRWLIELNRHATQFWLKPDNPVLDYANAMVSGTSSGSPADWQEHVDGKPQYAPPVPPLAPAKFTAGLYLKGNIANCLNFDASEQKGDANYVQKVLPNQNAFPSNGGFTPGLLGYMFWAAGKPSARRSYADTTDCRGGMGRAADAFDLPIPMPDLRKR